MDIGTESARILADYLAGKEEAAREIFDHYTRRLVGLARQRLSERLWPRVDPEDIVQSVYRSFFRKAGEEGFVPERNGSLWNLLAAMTVKKTLKRVQFELAQKRDPAREEPGSAVRAALRGEPTPEEAATLIDLLASFLGRLKERDRRVLELRLQGESVEAIAEQVHVSEATVRRVLARTGEELGRALLAD